MKTPLPPQESLTINNTDDTLREFRRKSISANARVEKRGKTVILEATREPQTLFYFVIFNCSTLGLGVVYRFCGMHYAYVKHRKKERCWDVVCFFSAVFT